MAVYIDDAFVSGDWGRWTGGGHLQADTRAELDAFAVALGLSRAWIQTKPGRPDHDHYDLTHDGRARALALGATPESWREGARRRRARRADVRPAGAAGAAAPARAEDALSGGARSGPCG